MQFQFKAYRENGDVLKYFYTGSVAHGFRDGVKVTSELADIPFELPSWDTAEMFDEKGNLVIVNIKNFDDFYY